MLGPCACNASHLPPSHYFLQVSLTLGAGCASVVREHKASPSAEKTVTAMVKADRVKVCECRYRCGEAGLVWQRTSSR